MPVVHQRKRIGVNELKKNKGINLYGYGDIFYISKENLKPMHQLLRPYILPKGLYSYILWQYEWLPPTKNFKHQAGLFLCST